MVRLLLFVLSVAALVAACASGSRSPNVASGSGGLQSNILREDYAGSKSCRPCHSAISESWDHSPMHNMTRDAKSAQIKAPFAGLALPFKDDTVTLEEKNGERYAAVHMREEGDHIYRVTRVIGGHYREDYAGVEVDSSRTKIIGDPHDELILPVSYLIFSGTFRYKGYSVMSRERAGLRPGPVWNQTCIFCHNTQPYFSTLLGTLPTESGHTSPYQGTTVDHLLPEAKRWSTTVTHRAELDAALKREIQHLSGVSSDRDLVSRAVSETRSGFDGTDLIEVGIGCEACHLGAAAHVRDPTVRPSYVPTSPFLTASAPQSTHAEQINHVCARCHQVLFTHYPYTWEGGARSNPVGGSNINSGEARDFLLGKCSSQADCVRCHDPHASDNQNREKELNTQSGDGVCTACHSQFVTGAAVRAHTHHDPAQEGSRCMNCHMPRKNMSLDGRLTRYHRIGSPTDAAKQKDRPFECALCHADKKVDEILSLMETWWNKRFDRTLPTLLYGSLDANVMSATLSLGKPHEQAVALFVLGEKRSVRDARAMANELLNPYPLVRTYANAALEKTLNSASPINLNGTDETIRSSAAAWLEVSRIPALSR